MRNVPSPTGEAAAIGSGPHTRRETFCTRMPTATVPMMTVKHRAVAQR